MGSPRNLTRSASMSGIIKCQGTFHTSLSSKQKGPTCRVRALKPVQVLLKNHPSGNDQYFEVVTVNLRDAYRVFTRGYQNYIDYAPGNNKLCSSLHFYHSS